MTMSATQSTEVLTRSTPAPEQVDVLEDNDSTLGSDVSSTYTESVRSSLLQSVRENGRGYHKYREGHYYIPEDEQEQERLDMQHDMFIRTFDGRLNLAPLPDGITDVLDIGTGTGLWAIDFADEHPEAMVLGTDLSPIQPTSVPLNCKFEVDDFEEPWTFSQKFDYIHGRMLMGSYSDGKKLLQRAYDALKPGGYLELQDGGFPLRCDDDSMKGTAWEHWGNLFSEALGKMGRNPSDTYRFGGWMKEVGFEDVTEHLFKWPQNTWPKDRKLKELGRWNLINTLDGIQGFSVRLFTHVLGMSPEAVELLLVDVRKDVQNRKIHCWWPIMVIHARKPK